MLYEKAFKACDIPMDLQIPTFLLNERVVHDFGKNLSSKI